MTFNKSISLSDACPRVMHEVYSDLMSYGLDVDSAWASDMTTEADLVFRTDVAHAALAHYSWKHSFVSEACAGYLHVMQLPLKHPNHSTVRSGYPTQLLDGLYISCTLSGRSMAKRALPTSSRQKPSRHPS